MTCDVTKDTVIPLLYLKVLYISTDRKGKFSNCKVIKVKDITAQKHFIRLYGEMRNQVEVGFVYKFVALLAQSYRAEGENLGRLRSQSESRVSLASEEINALFSHVSFGQKLISGQVIGHEQIHFYECCSQCLCKNYRDGTASCKVCGSKIDENKLSYDFNVNIVLECEEELKTVLAFRSQLGYDFNKIKQEHIQAEVAKRNMQICVVEYDEDENDSVRDIIRAQSVKFPEETADSDLQ
jgi:hypothetical protein